MATTKHHDLPKAKEWHREHFRRQGSNTSTQSQTSSSQRTVRENPGRIQPKYNHQVAKESRPSLEKGNNPSESCTSTKRTTSHSHVRKIVAPYSGFTEMRSRSEAAFEESREYSSTRSSSLRIRWNSILAQIDENMHDPHPNTRSWNFDKWLDALSDASDWVKFE